MGDFDKLIAPAALPDPDAEMALAYVVLYTFDSTEVVVIIDDMKVVAKVTPRLALD